MNSTGEEAQNISQQYHDAFIEAAICLEHSWRKAGGYLDSRQRKRIAGYHPAVTLLARLHGQLHQDQHEVIRTEICEVLTIFGLEPLYKAISKDVTDEMQEFVAAQSAHSHTQHRQFATT